MRAITLPAPPASEDLSPADIRKYRDPRCCRTHAFAAYLFAVHPVRRANAQTWIYIAHAWAELAELRLRMNQNWF